MMKEKTMHTYSNTTKTQYNANTLSLHHARSLCKQDRLDEALQILSITEKPLNFHTYLELLQGCIKKKDL